MLGLLVGFVAVGVAFFALADILMLWESDQNRPLARLWILLPCVLFFGLGYFLYSARDWARRVFLALCMLAVLYSSVMAVIRFQSSFDITGELSPRDWWSIVRYGILSALGGTFCVLPPLAFLIQLLRHREVVAAFQQHDRMRTESV